MNAGKLVDFVRTFLQVDIPGAELPAVGHVLDLLNQAQDEASAELGIPMKLVEITNQSSAFNLPADARTTNPIIEARFGLGEGGTRLLRELSIERAGLEYPDWETSGETGDPEVLIYSTGVDSIPMVYPHPMPVNGTFYVLYRMKPADMTDLNDEPFNGELDRFHIMLAHYVTFMLNNNQQRFAIYRSMLGDAAGVRQRGPRVTQNAAYRMTGRWFS